MAGSTLSESSRPPIVVTVPTKPKQLKVLLLEYFDRTRLKLKPFLTQAELYIGFNTNLFIGED
jgi:hypothetical protein